MKKKTPFIVMLVLALFVMVACGGQNTPTEDTQPIQGTPSVVEQPITSGMVIAKNIQLDPALATDNDSQLVVVNIYETLATPQGGDQVPGLAASIIPSVDGLAYTVNLRPGVQFHDGSLLNADAVIANFNRWFDPEDPAHGAGSYEAWLAAFQGFKGEKDEDGKSKSIFDGAEKLNETTVILHLNTPDPDFIVTLTNPAFSIVNPIAFNADGFGTTTGQDGGTGRYTIDAFTESSLTLTPFADYWNSSNAAKEEVEFSLSQ